MGGDNVCVLVIIGVLEEGTKELVAVRDGYRESKESWLEVLRDLQSRGLSVPPKLAVGDGALGFWGALEEQYGEKVAVQRCWVHKMRTVRTKGCGSRAATLSMVFKLTQHAQNHWRKLNGHALLPKVLRAVRFDDGIEQIPQPANQQIAA